MHVRRCVVRHRVRRTRVALDAIALFSVVHAELAHQECVAICGFIDHGGERTPGAVADVTRGAQQRQVTGAIPARFAGEFGEFP